MEAGVATQAEQAQRLARDWMIQLERDTAQDPALLTRLDTMHAAEPGLQQRTGVSHARLCWRRSPNTAGDLPAPPDGRRVRPHAHALRRKPAPWPELLAQLQRYRSERLPPEHERVIALARRWGELFSAYAGPNADTQRRIQQAEQQEPELQAGTWVAPELIDYLRQAMTALMQHARNRQTAGDEPACRPRRLPARRQQIVANGGVAHGRCAASLYNARPRNTAGPCPCPFPSTISNCSPLPVTPASPARPSCMAPMRCISAARASVRGTTPRTAWRTLPSW